MFAPTNFMYHICMSLLKYISSRQPKVLQKLYCELCHAMSPFSLIMFKKLHKALVPYTSEEADKQKECLGMAVVSHSILASGMTFIHSAYDFTHAVAPIVLR